MIEDNSKSQKARHSINSNFQFLKRRIERHWVCEVNFWKSLET